MKTKLISLLLIASLQLLYSQEYKQTFIAIRNTGVEQFHDEFAEYDGRGTIIFIFDTGVDMGVEGLTKTSTGEVKVIDAQDFTGQGDINFYEADIDEADDEEFFIYEDMGYKVGGAGKLKDKSIDDDYFIGVLPEKTWINSGSGITDINGNGSEDDLFYFVTFKTEGNEWILYFDTNGDGSLSDESPYKNYKDSLEPLFIKSTDGMPLLTFAINIFPEEKKVSFFFDDGSHGTHCSGISAGNNIGNSGFSGVAPGANIIACKIGNNNFAGGATVTESMKKAFLYADKISKERNEPCIISMSYGIGSEIETYSDMEKFIEKLSKENPYIYISLSNSNEGPGISSTGMPSSSPFAFSSGAVLATEVGRDAYGTVLDKDIILHFSSRGAAVLKPDVVAPGAAFATVPNHASGDRMWGTSMAAPYSTGVLSLLLSAAKSEFPDVKIPSQFLYKVVRESATKMTGYDYVDQGAGYINVVAAWQLLKQYIKAGEINKFETYTVDSFAPNMPDNKAPGLYIRNGAYITENESFSYSIKRNNFIKSAKFYRTYNLKSDSDWLIPSQKKLHIRNDQGAKVDVHFDKSILTKPGLYNGKIFASRNDASNTPEFELMATLVIPFRFDSENGYTRTWENVEVSPGQHQRYFLSVPAGSSDMRIKINSDANEFTQVRYFLYDNDGRQITSGVFNAGMQDDFFEEYFQDLETGIYEFDIVGYYTDISNSIYDLTIDIDGIQKLENNDLSDGKNDLHLVNVFDEVKKYNISASILGYQKIENYNLKANEPCEVPFTFSEGEKSKKFFMTMSKEDFNKVTDFAIVIYDKDGKTAVGTSINYSFADVEIINKSKEDQKYILKLLPGFANAGSEMKVTLTEYTSFENSTAINCGKKYVTLYPTAVEKIVLDGYKPQNSIPVNTKYWGKLYLNNPSSSKTEIDYNLFFK